MSQPLRRNPNLRVLAKALRRQLNRIRNRKLRTAARKHLVTVLKYSPELEFHRNIKGTLGHEGVTISGAFVWIKAGAPNPEGYCWKNHMFWNAVQEAVVYKR